MLLSRVKLTTSAFRTLLSCQRSKRLRERRNDSRFLGSSLSFSSWSPSATRQPRRRTRICSKSCISVSIECVSAHLAAAAGFADEPQLCPDYIGIELGIGESLLVKAIAESTGRATTKIKEDLRKEGDLGKVAMVSPPASSSRLAKRLIELAKYSTHNVQAETSDCPFRVSEVDGHRESLWQCRACIRLVTSDR
jgi:hypothetical protein